MEDEIFDNIKGEICVLNSSTDNDVFDCVHDKMQPDNVSAENVLFQMVNGSSDYRRPRGRDEELAKIEVAVLATIFTLAVLGNVCVLVDLARRRKITSRMHIFIFHLSVADLLVAFCNILPQLAWDITGSFHGGDPLCRIVTFLQVFVLYLSTYVLVMTAVDRYRAICYPLSNHNWTPSTVNSLITLVYLLSAALSIPQPLLFKYQMASEDGEYECWARFEPSWLLQAYVITFTILIYIIPVFILVFAYGSICYTIWVHQSENIQKQALRNLDGSSGQEQSTSHKSAGETRYVCSTAVSTNVPSRIRWTTSRRNNSSGSLVGRDGVILARAHNVRGFSRARLKTVKLTFVVILAYLFCWSPFFISQLWWLYDPKQESNKAVVIMVLLSSLNSCCNPWIYLAFSGNLLRHSFPCLAACCPRSSSYPPLFYFNPTPLHRPPCALDMASSVNSRRNIKEPGHPHSTSSPILRHKSSLRALGKENSLSRLRHGSLKSFFPIRASRNVSETRLQHHHQQQQQQTSLTSAGTAMHNRLLGPLQLSERSRQSVSLGSGLEEQNYFTPNIHIIRKSNFPSQRSNKSLMKTGFHLHQIEISKEETTPAHSTS